MPRHRCKRFERRYGGACLGRVGSRPLDVERCSETRALARAHETQCFVLGRRYGAYRIELMQCADEDEVVGRDVGDDEQTNATRRVFCRARVGCRGRRACAQTTRDVDFPRNLEAALPALRVRRRGDGVLGGRVVTRPLIGARGLDPNARIQP